MKIIWKLWGISWLLVFKVWKGLYTTPKMTLTQKRPNVTCCLFARNGRAVHILISVSFRAFNHWHFVSCDDLQMCRKIIWRWNQELCSYQQNSWLHLIAHSGVPLKRKIIVILKVMILCDEMFAMIMQSVDEILVVEFCELWNEPTTFRFRTNFQHGI